MSVLRSGTEVLVVLLFIQFRMEQVQLRLHVGVDGEKTFIRFIPKLLHASVDVFMSALNGLFQIFFGWNWWFGRHGE
jgi:hypothetical protein